MRKIFPQTDLIIEVQVFDAEGNIIPMHQINYLDISLFTCFKDMSIHYYKNDIDSSGNLCIPSQDLAKLPSGVMKYKYQVNYIDTRFPDDAYDYSDVIQTDCYLMNTLCCEGPREQYSDQYVTKLWLAKHGLIDSSTDVFVTEYELAAALEAYAKAEGTQGYMGTQGYEGAQGFIGPQGYPGVQGEVGPQGYEGVQGYPGEQGIQGVEGTQGFIGPQGYPGEVGPQGYEGVQGNPGEQGTQGFIGPQGNPGEQGSQGLIGPQGYMGAQGLPGMPGTQGLQGAQGFPGAQGEPGEFDYENYYTKSQVDASINAVYGIISEDEEITSQTFLGINGRLDGIDASVQAIENFLPGTQGYIGTQGYEGAQGYPGVQGPIGAQGEQGAQGYPGVQGNPGEAGTQGEQGAQGYPGVQGNPGEAGTQGEQGAQGYEGAQGPIGTQGLIGPQGYPGPAELSNYYTKSEVDSSINAVYGVISDDEETTTQALLGINGRLDTIDSSVQALENAFPGTQGYIGTQGYQGAQGYEGPQGPIGTQGYIGPQGNPGAEGAQGPIGTQGYAGAQGEPGPASTNYYTKSEIDASLGVCVTSPNIRVIVEMSQTDYDNLGTHDASTWYIIK